MGEPLHVLDLPAPRACGLHLPGHEAHWIQARRSSLDTDNRPVEGRVHFVARDGRIEIRVRGRIQTYWHHQPERLAVAAAHANGEVTVQWRWRLLRVRSHEGFYVFCVADVDDHRTCPHVPPSGDPPDLCSVEVMGFEPTASSMRPKRSSQLSYTPGVDCAG